MPTMTAAPASGAERGKIDQWSRYGHHALLGRAVAHVLTVFGAFGRKSNARGWAPAGVALSFAALVDWVAIVTMAPYLQP